MFRWLDTHQPRLLSVVMLIALATMYSLGFLSASLATLDFGPVSAGALRVIFASFFLLAISRIFSIGLVTSRLMWKYAFAYGVPCMAIPLTLLPWTLTYISNTTAAIYYAVIPLKVLVLSKIFLGSPISIRKWIGFVIASGGLIFLAISGSKGAGDTISSLNWRENNDLPLWLPHVTCIMTALFIAAGGVLFQKMPKTSPISITASALLMGNLVAIPALILTLPSELPSAEGLLWAACGGVVATGCGMILRGTLIRRENAIFTSTNGYVVPIITALIGVLALGENIGLVAFFSYALVLIGLLLSRN